MGPWSVLGHPVGSTEKKVGDMSKCNGTFLGSYFMDTEFTAHHVALRPFKRRTRPTSHAHALEEVAYLSPCHNTTLFVPCRCRSKIDFSAE